MQSVCLLRRGVSFGVECLNVMLRGLDVGGEEGGGGVGE